jgi:hypothetical protein
MTASAMHWRERMISCAFGSPAVGTDQALAFLVYD